MLKKITQILALSTCLLMYMTLEVALIKELGWQGGLVASFFFTTFAIIAFACLLYRPPVIDLDEEADENAKCRP